MSYEQALSIVGDEPTWVLRDLIDRLHKRHPVREAARVALLARNSKG